MNKVSKVEKGVVLERNIKLIVAYEGRGYLGGGEASLGLSLQSELERCLSIVLRHPVFPLVAIPTEAGVHAEGQVVNFFTLSSLSLSRLHRSLNALLPKEISIRLVEEEALSFDSRLEIQRVEYHYAICFGPIQFPFYRFVSWHVPDLTNTDGLQEAVNALSENHPLFTCIQHIPERPPISHPTTVIMDKESRRLFIQIMGDRVLYRFIRNLIGILVAIGKGNLALESFKLVKQADLKSMEMIAPPHGLLLKKIFYI